MTNTTDLQQIYEEAIQHHQAGKLLEAEQLYHQILAVNPNEAQVHSNLSNVLLNMGKPEEAVEHASKCVTLNPEIPEVHYNLANLLMHNKRNEEAEAAYRQALELNPAMGHAHYNLGSLLYMNGDSEAAKAAFQLAAKHAPELAAAHLNLGHILAIEGHYEEALESLNRASAIDPQHPTLHKNRAMVLHATNALNEAYEAIVQAIAGFPNDVECLVLKANILRDLGRLEEAETGYNKALELDPEHAIAKENIARISGQKVAAWHFDMLADTHRNAAYDKALKKAVKPHMTVLDIGTGTGLLAMMAARAGAQQVVACEMEDVIADAARKIIAANNYTDKITIINQKSTALAEGDQLPEKADLLVSEILDAGLLGEGVIPTHRHAVQHLLKPEGIVVPMAADVQAILLQSDYLHDVNPLTTIEGFDLSLFNEFRLKGTYITRDLAVTPHEPLTEVFTACTIDFKHLPPAAEMDHPNKHELAVTVQQSGTIHGAAFWFNLHVDQDISLSSGPEGEMVHWGQVLFLFDTPRKVKAGEKVALTVTQADTLIGFSL